ncbi:hypothetical protein SDC9_123120 [bioreactor metagenome]|uniref:Uncharacterized protein n=1 Tax=bioreactor metagenome TaxID=1076179 RepID=A0A645CGS1_9ZZZZ
MKETRITCIFGMLLSTITQGLRGLRGKRILWLCFPQTLLHGLFNGVEDVFIPRAAAEMTGEEFSELVARVLLAGFEDLHGGHDKSRRAEAALNGRFVHKRLLDVAELSVGAEQALQRADVLAFRPDGEVDAGVVAFPVDNDVAGAAFADFAAFFNGSQAVVVSEHVRQRGANVHIRFHVLAVDITLDKLFLH